MIQNEKSRPAESQGNSTVCDASTLFRRCHRRKEVEDRKEVKDVEEKPAADIADCLIYSVSPSRHVAQRRNDRAFLLYILCLLYPLSLRPPPSHRRLLCLHPLGLKIR